MPNRKDVLLGLYDGTFGILSSRGVFYLKNQAHEKAIDLLAIRYIEGSKDKAKDRISHRNSEKEECDFEIVSVGRD